MAPRSTTKERLELARIFLDQYDKLERKDCDRTGWLMLKFSCRRQEAQFLVDWLDGEREMGERYGKA